MKSVTGKKFQTKCDHKGQKFFVGTMSEHQEDRYCWICGMRQVYYNKIIPKEVVQ